MSEAKKITGLLSIWLIVFGISSSPAKSDIPPRCLHAIISSTANFGKLVSNQLSKHDGTSELKLAYSAIVLTAELGCPKDKTLKSIDCIVALVHSTNKEPQASDIVQCVFEATGQTLFKVK